MINSLLFGEKLRKCRIAKKLTMAELAELSNISYRYLGDIERGEKIPKLDTLLIIANVLEVSLDYLLQDSLSIYKKQDIQNLIYKLPLEQQTLILKFVSDLAEIMN